MLLLRDVHGKKIAEGKVVVSGRLQIAAEITGVKKNGEAKIRFATVATSDEKPCDVANIKTMKKFVKDDSTELRAVNYRKDNGPFRGQTSVAEMDKDGLCDTLDRLVVAETTAETPAETPVAK